VSILRMTRMSMENDFSMIRGWNTSPGHYLSRE
jgi:hypothetical protein